MTDLYPRSLHEEPPSAARTASGGSFSSTPGELDDGSGICSRKPGQGDGIVLPGLPSSSPPVTPHPPGGLHPFRCSNCNLDWDEAFCDFCGKQLPLICAAGRSGARNAQGEGEAPQATLPGLTRTPRTPQPGRTT